MSLDHYQTLGRCGARVSPLALGAMNFDDGPTTINGLTSTAFQR